MNGEKEKYQEWMERCAVEQRRVVQPNAPENRNYTLIRLAMPEAGAARLRELWNSRDPEFVAAMAEFGITDIRMVEK